MVKRGPEEKKLHKYKVVPDYLPNNHSLKYGCMIKLIHCTIKKRKKIFFF